MKRVCVFGASITSGLNDFAEGGWCDLLKRDLIKKGIFIFNLGISGDDSSDLLKRFEPECASRRPDGIILTIGGNDSQFFMDKNEFRIDIKETCNNFEKLIEIAKKHTNNIIIIGLTRIDEERINSVYIKRKRKYYKNENTERYDKAISDIAKKHDIKFIPIFDVLDEKDLSDGLHPTSEGHRKLFVRIRGGLVLSSIGFEFLEGDF